MRRSERVPFDPHRPLAESQLTAIIEARGTRLRRNNLDQGLEVTVHTSEYEPPFASAPPRRIEPADRRCRHLSACGRVTRVPARAKVLRKDLRPCQPPQSIFKLGVED